MEISILSKFLFLYLDRNPRSKPYAMLPERLQTTLPKKYVPLIVSGLCNLGPMQYCPRGPKQYCIGKNSDKSGYVI